ncbi:MAG: ADP-ribosylglycohydrolase family protein [Deltaproteobacteria bacterium]|nr:ADP-ribosylglycohydrolase family protein [Deltaproteobacteria bacterium]
MEEQALGMLFGLALGDALGGPVKFKSVQEIQAEYGPRGILEPPEPALFTDDTQMTLAVAEALIEAGHQDLETLMAAVSRRFIAWLNSPENTRAPGNTCLEGCRRLEAGIPWRQSGKAGSKGCGAAMRVAPIGYFYQHDVARLKEVAAATALCTHNHPTALVAAQAAAYLVKLALDEILPGFFLPRLKEEFQGQDPEFDQALNRLEQALRLIDLPVALAHIGSGWVAEEAVMAAFYCFLEFPYDFRNAVRLAANIDGDSDSVACITGGISGAYRGLKNLPQEWLKRLEKADYLADVARRLVQARGKS